MENHKIRIAITQGDTNGIGYELIFKTFAEPEMLEICTPIIYGSPKVAAFHSNAIQERCQYSIIKDAREARDGRVNLIPCFDEEIKVEFGKSSIEANTAAVKALDKALADGREGMYDALVCGPVNKGSLETSNFKFPGTVKFIESSMGKDAKVQALYLNDIIRVTLACNGGVKETAGQLSVDNIVAKVKTLHATLKRDFRLSSPRIAVLALNPQEGTEEKEIITPAVTTLAETGIQAFGPYQAEEFFANRKYEAFDAILAMYHDQGLLPLKMLSDDESIIALTNIPLVCTMPDTDARYDIAGKDMADESVMRNAIYRAIDICRYRKEYDEPMANPLPKLYHERPDNGEKLRFSIPKKKEE